MASLIKKNHTYVVKRIGGAVTRCFNIINEVKQENLSFCTIVIIVSTNPHSAFFRHVIEVLFYLLELIENFFVVIR